MLLERVLELLLVAHLHHRLELVGLVLVGPDRDRVGVDRAPRPASQRSGSVVESRMPVDRVLDRERLRALLLRRPAPNRRR